MDFKDKRIWLLNKLACYQPWDNEELNELISFKNFIESNPSCFENTSKSGHITGSAIIVDSSFENILIIYSPKFSSWLQPGGHSDGEGNTFEVTKREIIEETGLKLFEPINNDDIFDLDIHFVPQTNFLPTHKHYDIRFLFKASMNSNLKINQEATKIEWVPIKNVQNYQINKTLIRPLNKLNKIRKTKSLFQQN